MTKLVAFHFHGAVVYEEKKKEDMWKFKDNDSVPSILRGNLTQNLDFNESKVSLST